MRAIYNLKCENWGLAKIGDCPQFNLKNGHFPIYQYEK
jgi:hypothetical protein